MGTTLYEAAKSFQNPLAAGLFKAIVTEDELFSLLPFVPKSGNAFSYNRVKSLPSAEWVSPLHTSLAESTGQKDLVTVPVREVASNFKLKNFTLAQQGGAQQVADQMMMKAKAVGRAIASALISGNYVTGHALGDTADPFAAITAIDYGPFLDSLRFGPGEIEYDHSETAWRFRAPGDRTFGDWVTAAADGTFTLKSDNPNKYIVVTLDVSAATGDGRTSIEFTSTSEQPDGLEVMLSNSGTVRQPTNANGDDFAFDILDELLDTVKVRDNLAFIMPSALRRRYKAKLRALGGAMPEFVIRSYSGDGEPVERRVLAYEDVPILKNDFIGTDEVVGTTSNASSIYLVSLDSGTGEGLYAGAFGGASTEADVDPVSKSVLGFQMIPVGQMEGENSQLWRAVWYGGFGLGSELAGARASGIKTV